MKVAVLGYGVVGAGVVEILDRYDDALVKYILNLNTIEDARFIQDANIFLKDADIKIVVEATGNIEVGFDLLSKAMALGKHTVTSSKGLVAKYGDTLLKIAKDNGVNFMFEASVGGGIPLLSMMRHGLGHEPIYEVMGILNGTSNYILTQMRKEGLSFEVALKQAQDLGYAELDPTDDIKGYDTARKIAILASILTHKKVNFEQVSTLGIDEISSEMLAEVSGRVRLVASLVIHKDCINISVAPTIVDQDHPFYGVEGVDNAVLFRGKDVGDVLIKGAGAGRYPTASAMVSDVFFCLKGLVNDVYWSDADILIAADNPQVKVLGAETLVSLSDVKDKAYLRVLNS